MSKFDDKVRFRMLADFGGCEIKYDGVPCILIAISVDGWILVDYDVSGLEISASGKKSQQVYEQDSVTRVKFPERLREERKYPASISESFSPKEVIKHIGGICVDPELG